MTDNSNMQQLQMALAMNAKCIFLNQNFLSQCRDRVVLEIGCFDGWITERIVTNNPAQLILLESSKSSVETVTKKFPTAKIVHGDLHVDGDMQRIGKVDVALLLGVIYHSHAPLHMLEQLVNFCSPEIIIMDNLNPVFIWHDEIPNVAGMRSTVDGRRTCDIIINIDRDITVRAMENLGYSLILEDTYPVGAQAAGCPIYQFEKNDR